MNIEQQSLVYFSATKNTQTLVRKIAQSTGLATKSEHNITKVGTASKLPLQLTSSELLIIGIPSFAGRVPGLAVDAINSIKGENTPAIIVCSYGNRDYDDTLLELKNLVEANGFKVVSAGAFVGTHSIFSQVGSGRPNESDGAEVEAFVSTTMDVLAKTKSIDLCEKIEVKGNFPYREPGNIPIHPRGDSTCDKCGTCVHLCPTDAIPADNPRKTIGKKCISCARCIAVCPQHARAFRGLLYTIAKRSFVKKNSEPKGNITSYIK